MAVNRNAPARRPAEAAVDAEKGCEGHDKTAPTEPTPPRAGRTGGLGTRAERPSPGPRRKATPQDKEAPRRGAKAPSAHSDDRSSK